MTCLSWAGTKISGAGSHCSKELLSDEIEKVFRLHHHSRDLYDPLKRLVEASNSSQPKILLANTARAATNGIHMHDMEP